MGLEGSKIMTSEAKEYCDDSKEKEIYYSDANNC
jgi:hypothetical protein